MKERLKNLVKKRLKTLNSALLSHAAVRRTLEAAPFLGAKLSGWERTHPFDRRYGTDTSGFLPVQMITSDPSLASAINPYGGSQPGVARHALVALRETEDYNFVDLGCGKGRAMIVASEFPFRSISGVELSAQLAKVARRNIALVERRYPRRPPLAVTEGNAVTCRLPEGKLAIYLYHSFGEALLSQLVKKLEAALAQGAEHMFFVYYNPVHGDLVDASPAFTRWYAANLPYDASEIGFGPDTHDAVVIWQSVNGAKPTPHANAAKPIVIRTPLWKAAVTD